MPVQQLVSVQHLGADTYNSLCYILAKMDIRDTDRFAKTVLRQCTVYEDTNGTPVALDKRTDIRLLPNQFVRLYEDKDRNADMSKHSRMLLDMLQRNVDAYQTITAAVAWEETSHLISTKPIFVKAAVVSPYESSPSPVLVSLEDSEDYSHHRLVASVVAVTEATLGDTAELRAKLDLPAGPQAVHVVAHLLHTAQVRNEGLQAGQNPGPLNKLIQEDVQKAYSVIIGVVSHYLTKGEHRELAKLTKKLAEAPWVMVQNCQRFVAPCDLVFEIEEDLEHAIQVPEDLLKLLKDKPAVRQWMTDKLQAKRWGPLWESGTDTLVLDNLLRCEQCSIQASHSTALMFFEFFYTWQVTWPGNEADVASALELLFMASVYDVPYLLSEAEGSYSK
ncbi:hypothetical protein WJX82_009008 [Trebouxia sp. C0006]